MKKIIPPQLFLICVLLMIGLHFLFPQTKFINFPFTLIGTLPIIVGLGMAIKVSRNFRSANTVIHTFKKPTNLVTNGIFKYSRNPIYLGFFIALFGVLIILGNLISIVAIIIFFITADYWYIPFEEKQLEEIFGKDYHTYKNKVRRWI